MKIGTRLLVFFILIVALTLGFFALVIVRQSEINKHNNQELAQIASKVTTDSELNSLAANIRYYDEVLTQSARNYAFTANIFWRNRYEEAAPKLDEDIKSAIAQGDEEDKATFASIDEANLALVQMEENSMNRVAAGGKDEAIAILESAAYADQKNIYKKGLEDFFGRRGAKLDETLTVSSAQINEQISQAERSASLGNFEFITLMGLFLILVIFFYYSTKGRIASPLIEMQRLAEKIAAGDLDQKIAIYAKDEIGSLAESFNHMTDSLKEARYNIEAKIAERTESLEEAKASDEAYLSSLGEGVIVVNTHQNIILSNPEAAKILGHANAEMLGHDVTHFVKLFNEDGDEIQAEQRPIILAIQKGQKVTRTDHLIQNKSGQKIPVAVTTAPVKLNGEIIGAIDVFRDISYEKEIDKAKTEFVSLASHQLRTPLSAINWYTEMLLAGDVGKVSPAQKKYLNEIYKGNQRMVDLVNALLDVSRIELGTFAIEVKKVQIVDIAKSVIKELEAQLKNKKQKLVASYGKVPAIRADDKLMRIIFQNLLSNAIKYTPDKGTINLAVSSINKNIQIKIKDTGYGIPENQQKSIFTKLFRADNVRIKDTEGTGLGLYIVKSILDTSGGKISFKSEENKGTTFIVEIPLAGMKQKKGMKTLEDIK